MLIEKNLEYVVGDLLKSKKYSMLGKEYIRWVVKHFCSAKIIKLFENEESKVFSKNKEYKSFLKRVKLFLHETYSVYQTKNLRKKEKILSLMKKTKDKKNLLDLHLDMLHLHSSTRERKKNYELIYRNIFSVCGKPKKILDFGCGLNAFSLPFIGFRDFNYTCCDSVEKDVLLINDYLKSFGKKFGFKGDSFFVNVFSEDYLKKICKKKYDVCFLFKMTDVMDYGSKKHNNTEKFLRNINSNFVVLSFPTKTVSGKRMNRPRRKWFEMMVKRIGYSLDYFEVNNECFYIVSK